MRSAVIHRPKKPYRMGRLPQATITTCSVCSLASTSGSVCLLCKPSQLKSAEREYHMAKAKTVDAWIAAYLMPDEAPAQSGGDEAPEVTTAENQRKAAMGDAVWSAGAKQGHVTRHRNNGTLPKTRARPDVTGMELPL